MKIGALKQAPIWIATVVIGLVCATQLIRHDFVERLERMTFDWRVRLAAQHSSQVATNLAFVYISDETIDVVNSGALGLKFGLYWPRQVYGRVVRQLRYAGARVVAFDILFGGLRPDHPPVQMADGSIMESDDYLALQLRQAGNVIIAADQGVIPPQLFRTNALVVGDITADQDSDGILRRVKAFRTYRKWHPVFQQLNDDPDYGIDLEQAISEPHRLVLPRLGGEDPLIVPLNKDGNFDVADFIALKKIPPKMARYDKPFTIERLWDMGIAVAAQQLKLNLTNANVDLVAGEITLFGPDGLRRVIPVDKDGFFYVNWSLPVHNDARLTQAPFEALLAQDSARITGDTNRFAKYLRPKDHRDWQGKLVFIGSSATGNDLTDRGATPLEKNTLLVSEHWNVANSVLIGQFVQQSSVPAQMLMILFMGLLAAYLTWTNRAHVIVASFWILVSLIAYVGLAALIYIRFRYWMPMVLPLVGALLTTHFCLLGYLVFFEQAERRRVRSVFTKVVSPDVVTELLNSDKLSIDGAKRTVTIFFCDIRGFTEMTDVNRDKAEEYIREHQLTGDAAEEIEDQYAKDTLDTVNKYLTVIADVVLKHGGTVDKFIGDCVMAFWGAPVSNQHHALHCVRAAIDTQRAVFKLNHEREVENRQREAHNLLLAADGRPLVPLLPVLVVGTGVNTGAVTVGLMGSDDRVNYTVFGREVNLASRLETVSGRARIIISEATLAEIIQDDATLALSCKPLPPEKVKGIRNLVRIYEVPWREGESAAELPPEQRQHDNTGYFMAGERTESDTSTRIFK